MKYIFDTGLVLWLPFYELDGISFQSKDAYGHLCTVEGATKHLQGFSFDGSDDYMTVPDCTALNIRDAITLIAWIKQNAQTFNDRILDKNIKYLLYGNPANEMRLGIDADSVVTCQSLTTLSIGQWYHIAATYDKEGLGSNQIVYLNGEEGTPGSNTGQIDTTAGQDLYIGAQNTTPDAPFNGLMGEIIIYNRALTPAEIQRHYLSTRWRYAG